MTTYTKVADLPDAWRATSKAAGSTPVAATLNVCAAELEAALSQQPSAAGVPDGYVLVQQRDAHALAEWGKATAKPDGRSGVVWISARRVSDLLASAPEQRAAPDSHPVITLSGYSLLQALDFIAPERAPEQMEQCVSIQWGDARVTDVGSDPAGYYCWDTEYPDEGSIPLTDEPAAPEQRAAPAEQQGAGLAMDDECRYCHGDGMDPANDYLLPCPYCDGAGWQLGYEDDAEDEDDADDDAGLPTGLPPIDPPGGTNG